MKHRRALIGVCLPLALLLFFRYLFPVFLPFLLAYAITALLRRPARLLHRVTRLPLALCVLLLFFLFLGVFGFLAYALFSVLFRETLALLLLVYRDGTLLDTLFSRLSTALSSLSAFLPQSLEHVLPSMAAMLATAVKSLLPELLALLSGMLGSFLSALPRAAIATLFFFAAAFYLAKDGDALCSRLIALLPQAYRAHARRILHSLSFALCSYLRAYLCLFFTVFLLTLLGFMLLSVPYAALMALLCATVDILPLLGVGAVLLPYALYALLTGNGALSAGLFVLYAVTFLVRSLAEPHLLSKKLGIHPLLSLLCMYGGYRLFGVGMMIAMPLLASVLAAFLRSYREEEQEGEKK